MKVLRRLPTFINHNINDFMNTINNNTNMIRHVHNNGKQCEQTKTKGSVRVNFLDNLLE